MLRWSILLGTFALWLSCMLLVYVHCKPKALSAANAGAQAALDTLFAEDAELERGCRIFVDMQKLKFATAEIKPALVTMPWNGLDESRLTEVGWLKTTIKKRSVDATRVEQLTEAELQLPADSGLPMLGMARSVFGTISYRARSDISLDQGLETFDADLTPAQGGFKANTHGVRDGDTLNVIQQVFQDKTKLLDQRQKLPMGPRDAPTLELFPFQSTTIDIRPGVEWTVSMLDANSVDLTGSTPPRVINMKVKCVGKRRIFFEKEQVMAFEVRTEDNQARAWYSVDGVVLKQSCKLFDSVEVMVVRIDPKKLKTYFIELRGAQKAAAEKQGGAK